MSGTVNQPLISTSPYQALPRESADSFAGCVWTAGKVIFFPLTLLAEGIKLICHYLAYGPLLQIYCRSKTLIPELRDLLHAMGGTPFRVLTEDHIQLEGMHFENPHPINGAKTILLCSGCPESYEAFVAPMVDALLEMGHHVAIFNYRGFGESEGSPSEEGFYLDAEAVYQYLVNEKRVADAEIVPFGYSMGSAIATDLATHHPVDLVLDRYFSTMSRVAYDTCARISCSGLLCGNITKTIFYLGGAHFDVESKIQRTSKNILLAKANSDQQMLSYHEEKLRRNLEGRNVTYVDAFSGHTHNCPGNLWFHRGNGDGMNREPRERLENFLGTPHPALAS